MASSKPVTCLCGEVLQSTKLFPDTFVLIDILDNPNCPSCNEDLRQRIEENLIMGQPRLARHILGKPYFENGTDLIQGMKYCHICGDEYSSITHEKIRTYGNLYAIELNRTPELVALRNVNLRDNVVKEVIEQEIRLKTLFNL